MSFSPGSMMRSELKERNRSGKIHPGGPSASDFSLPTERNVDAEFCGVERSIGLCQWESAAGSSWRFCTPKLMMIVEDSPAWIHVSLVSTRDRPQSADRR